MRILFVNSLAWPSQGSGAERILWRQMRALQGLGHECTLLPCSRSEGLCKTQDTGITVWTAPLKNLFWPFFTPTKPHALKRALWHVVDAYNPFMRTALKQVVHESAPDVVVTHNLAGWSSMVWRTLAAARIPVIQVLHDNYTLCPRSTMFNGGNCASQCTACRGFRLPHIRLSRHVSAVIGVSQFVLDRHIRAGYFKDVAIQRVIHNTLPAPPPAAHLHYREEGSRLRFGYIGTLSPAKGVDTLIQGFAEADLAGAELLVAGTGELTYVAQLKHLAAPHPVRFLGYQDAGGFYDRIDVLVVPSQWHDTLPNVVMEGMARGLPVIAARRGGIPEMVTHQRSGLLYEPDNAGELSRMLRRAHIGAVLRMRLAEGASAAGAAFTDQSSWARKYEHLLKVVTEGAHERGAAVGGRRANGRGAAHYLP